jgi:Protein of unknown function (DUF3631)
MSAPAGNEDVTFCVAGCDGVCAYPGLPKHERPNGCHGPIIHLMPVSAQQPNVPDDDSGANILSQLAELLRKYVSFPSDHAVDAVTLWIAHSHALEAFDSTPRLAALSPEKGSGKTRLLEVISLLVPEPLHTINVSAAALFRLVADKQPTLLLDEADTYLGLSVAKQHEDIRGLVNAGHRRGATVYRGEVQGKAVKVVEFPAFAACALAGIGDLPDTILDRSVVIPMKRRAPNEQIEPFRERHARPGAEQLRDWLAIWIEGNVDHLLETFPDMPAGIVDRAADVWEPLIAIADLAGGDWPARARDAAVTLNRARVERDSSLGVQLLRDCRIIFTARNVDRLTTETLLEHLKNLDESPWGDLRGKPLDARGLARRLKKYGVHPGKHRFGEVTARGYLAEEFHDAWARYLPDVPDVPHVPHPQHIRETNGAVPHGTTEEGYVTPSIPIDMPLFTSGGTEQAEHAEHSATSRDV